MSNGSYFLSTFEAIDASVEYAEDKSSFDFQKGGFVFTARGWGNPRVVYNALPIGPGQHEYAGERYTFKLNQFKSAIAKGAFSVRGKRVPIIQGRHHTKISADEAAYLDFCPRDNVAKHNGSILYVDIQFLPADQPGVRQKAGRPSVEAVVLELHEKHKGGFKEGMTQKAYAEFLLKRAPTTVKKGLSVQTIIKHLRVHGKFL